MLVSQVINISMDMYYHPQQKENIVIIDCYSLDVLLLYCSGYDNSLS